VPLPTPRRTVAVDFSIESDGMNYFLVSNAQDKSFCWDSWHQSLEDAERCAADQYGIRPEQWITES
jgi:hypothetical protein